MERLNGITIDYACQDTISQKIRLIKKCQSYMRATTKTEQSTTFHHGSGAEPRWMNTFHMLPSKFLARYTIEVMKKKCGLRNVTMIPQKWIMIRRGTTQQSSHLRSRIHFGMAWDAWVETLGMVHESSRWRQGSSQGSELGWPWDDLGLGRPWDECRLKRLRRACKSPYAFYDDGGRSEKNCETL